ncbi:conserved hypothetical protein [Methanothermus fervidus DSM 2088]|uniref:VapC9 PIN-like domain-containing protein n=1 Tax=Methanothermus fervidus (strain ATCC 43054 / DSM 2088 / JCM 10308 / V24 S) TaxID=523846 RepID=E3GY63_METFV|nr:hypothetical protein [Methanothermus fervidus]ADP77245.1 conserved hypothetical protein [Methanothermus fervidus DSM 2088]
MVCSNKNVVLDTNFLFLPIQFKVDIIEEIKKLVPNCKIIVPFFCFGRIEKS